MLFVLAATPAAAQQATVIAVIDMQKISRAAQAAQEVRDEAEVYRKNLVADAGNAERDLRDEGEALKRQRAILSPEAFDEKRRAFDRKASDTQKRLVQRERALKRALDQARQQILDEIVKIVAEISKAQGYNVVLRRSQVEFFTPTSMDISDDVITMLDKRMPTLALPPIEGQ